MVAVGEVTTRLAGEDSAIDDRGMGCAAVMAGEAGISSRSGGVETITDDDDDGEVTADSDPGVAFTGMLVVECDGVGGARVVVPRSCFSSNS